MVLAELMTTGTGTMNGTMDSAFYNLDADDHYVVSNLKRAGKLSEVPPSRRKLYKASKRMYGDIMDYLNHENLELFEKVDLGVTSAKTIKWSPEFRNETSPFKLDEKIVEGVWRIWYDEFKKDREHGRFGLTRYTGVEARRRLLSRDRQRELLRRLQGLPRRG